jgi:hypothetical protein
MAEVEPGGEPAPAVGVWVVAVLRVAGQLTPHEGGERPPGFRAPEAASFLLRLLAPAIEAEYERSTGRLLRYRGVSNLAGPDGETLQVDIRYRELSS